MSASDFEDRSIATAEFLKRGLGAQLTRNAETLMGISSNSITSGRQRVVLENAFGNIAERALWVTFGNWMGYFNPVQVASEAEITFLREHHEAVQEHREGVIEHRENVLQNREQHLENREAHIQNRETNIQNREQHLEQRQQHLEHH